MRVFLAVPVPSTVKELLSKEQNRLRELMPDVRWADPETFHLTLKFLGEVELERMREIEAIAKKAGQNLSPFPVEVKGVGSFPSRRAAQVVWAGVSDGSRELAGLADSLGNELAELGFEREKRSYRPHITLGRSKSTAPLKEIFGKVGAGLSFGRFQAEELLVMESELRPQGPLHKVLSRSPFKEK